MIKYALKTKTLWLVPVLTITFVAAVALMAGSVRDSAYAEAGDFSLDFVAAEDTTYHKNGASEGSEIGTAEGQDLAYDDRTINTDVVEQLEAEDFACGDRIVFFTEVTVGGTSSGQTIFLEYDFDAENNGQIGVGYSDILNVGVSDMTAPFAAQQSGEEGNIGLDGDETATLIQEFFEPAGSTFGDITDPIDRASNNIGVVKITGLILMRP
jgi:hypothetical protein